MSRSIDVAIYTELQVESYDTLLGIAVPSHTSIYAVVLIFFLAPHDLGIFAFTSLS